MSLSLSLRHGVAGGAWIVSLFVLGTAPCMAQSQDAHCASQPSPRLSLLQARLLDKAAQGVVPLRQYIHITRNIYQLDLMQVVGWIDGRRMSTAPCELFSIRDDEVARLRD